MASNLERNLEIKFLLYNYDRLGVFKYLQIALCLIFTKHIASENIKLFLLL